MTDLNQPAPLAPSDQARLSTELLQARAQLAGEGVTPLVSVRLATRVLELRAQLGATDAAAPAIALTGTEFGEFPDTPEGKKELRAAAKAYLEGLRGQMVNCPALGAQVEIRQRGIKETIAFSANPKKLKLLHAIAQIISSAKVAMREDNHKQDKKPDVSGYFYLKSVVALADEQISVSVVVEQDSNGRLYYDLLIDPPKEKAMLDSSGRSPDHNSGHPPEQDIAPASQRTPDHNSGHRLDPSVEQDSSGVMLDAVGALVLNLFLEDEEPSDIEPVAAELATGVTAQKNGSVLVSGDPVALAAYAAANFDGLKVSQTADGIVLPKAKAGLATFIPTSSQTLASGAIVYEHGAMGGGASITYQGETSGVARDLANLKGIMAREWGAEKFQTVFGEPAADDDVRAYEDEQQAIADRKAQNAANAADRETAPERERQQAAEQAAADAAERAKVLAEQEAEKRAFYEQTTGAGVSSNPVYQAYLNTLEDLPTFEDGNHGFLGWAGARVAEFEAKVGGRVSNNREGYDAYLLEYSEAHLSERVRAARTAAQPVATGETGQPAPVTEEPAPVAPVPEIIEYTTKKQKVLRGIIRTDLTLEQAKAIDPYTWKMNGGYFIREKHLGGDTAHIQAAPTPVVMSAEQQAEAVATAERLAADRAKQALANQVEKLRQVANKAVDDADGSLNADRKTNTAKRSREAGYALEKAAANKAAGQTLNRIADSIEVGAAGMLTKLSSRAQLDELQRLMRRAINDADEKLDGMAKHARRGRAFEDNDLKYLAFPRPESWSNRYSRAADTLARKSAKGNSRLIAALVKMGNGPERFALNAADIALTRKAYAELKAVKEGWDLTDPMEAIGRADRLARMGITDTQSLVAAVQALIPHLVEKVQEDPVKKAERAIVGQKVGIDFFPTPAHVAQRMAQLAHIQPGMRVLEPSAGNGNLADAAKAAGGQVDVIEISDQLRNILTAKGYNVVDHNFDHFTPDEPYPAILMNPPFSNRQDAAHIMRAFGMLASGGTLVAIAGEGVFFGKDQKAVAFRDWLDSHGADVEPLEGGTFQDNSLLAQTGANARLIVIEK
jgi:protein-L-isoaspartate O-methyltransferase